MYKAIVGTLLALLLAFQRGPLQFGPSSVSPLITTYNGLSTAGQGIPVIVASVARTGIVASDGAAINLTTAVPAAGTYRLTYFIVTTTLFTTSGALITYTWTDVSGVAQSVASSATGVTVGNFVQGSSLFQSSGAANITYKITSAGTFGAAAAYVILERLA